MSGSDKPEAQTLLTLAGILGIPVERFFDDSSNLDVLADAQAGAPGTAQAGAEECLRLWSALRTHEGRARALTYLHGLIEEERR